MNYKMHVWENLIDKLDDKTWSMINSQMCVNTTLACPFDVTLDGIKWKRSEQINFYIYISTLTSYSMIFKSRFSGNSNTFE